MGGRKERQGRNGDGKEQWGGGWAMGDEEGTRGREQMENSKRGRGQG